LVAVVASVLVLLVIGGVWYGVQQREQSPGGGTAAGPQQPVTPAHAEKSPSASPSSNELAEAIALANTSTGGLLPADRCTATGTDQVACDHPYVGIDQVRFRTYASLPGLYPQYELRVRGLSDGRFPVNYGDCTRNKISGEVSWNHNFEHSHRFSVAQLRSGTLRDDTQAAGRVFCRLRNGVITIVWTDNHATLLGTVTGAPHSLVFRWWKRVHHDLAVGTMMDMHH
jgi:hypothetical protein